MMTAAWSRHVGTLHTRINGYLDRVRESLVQMSTGTDAKGVFDDLAESVNSVRSQIATAVDSVASKIEPRACPSCGGSIRDGNKIGVCTRNPKCRAEYYRRFKAAGDATETHVETPAEPRVQTHVETPTKKPKKSPKPVKKEKNRKSGNKSKKSASNAE